MKDFKIVVGGQERPLKFTHPDAEALEREFRDEVRDKGLRRLMIEDALGYAEVELDGGKKEFVYAGRFSARVRRAILFLSLRHKSPKITESIVADWMTEHTDRGDNIGDLIGPAVACAFYSGAITGERVDLQLMAEETAAALGKAPPEIEKPAPIPAAQ